LTASTSAPTTARSNSEIVYGLNVIAFVSGNLGLAVAARNTIRALLARGENICVADFDAGGGRSGHDLTYAHLACNSSPPPLAVNLIHMNPPDVVNVMVDDRRAVEVRDRLNVCVPFWELPRMPDQYWAPMLDSVDLVLAPTLHIKNSVEASCPNARVIHYPQAVFLPEGITADRARWGIPADALAFLMAMDVASDIERKNPLGALESFLRAFPLADGGNARLVIKLNNTRHSRRFEAETAELMASLAIDPRVIIVDEHLAYLDVLCLSASTDAYLSLHRAEGLGLNLLEAMSLGKPVVATAWSGNTDFMTAENSCLVDYTMTPVATTHPSYAPAIIGERQQWAEPDIDCAARWLRRLAEEPELRARLGEAARRDMDAARVAFLRGEAFDTIAAMWNDGVVATAEHRERAERLVRLRSISPYLRLRRAVGKTLRRAGLMR
jgi:glycosyltransferase involved in cell wall biosynthesis